MKIITRKYFPKKYIFKNDSSIGEGAELVLAPCTYKSLCEINFKEYFKEIIKQEATSYETGKCGLHVHISDNTSENYALNQIFYYVCASEIVKFSKRADSQLSQWASIGGMPEFRQDKTVIKNSQRYRAVNWTENTLEFRAFRGTLDYRRFKSTLQFIQASQDFLKTVKLPTILRTNILGESKADYNYAKNKLGWQSFRKYLKQVGQYRFLENYLNSQNL